MNGRALPSGIVTFLFTDIEGSTRRWEADPEVMRAALAIHDEVVRTAIEAVGGRVFKHTGDGVCAVFTSPRAAVEAAVAAQQALELPVRVDNCEHVLDAVAEMIENLLSRSSTVSILAVISGDENPRFNGHLAA
jgi:class 3 adenylate cyclase